MNPSCAARNVARAPALALLLACTGPVAQERASPAPGVEVAAPAPAVDAAALAARGRAVLERGGEASLREARALLSRSLELALDPAVAGDLARAELLLGTGYESGDRRAELLLHALEHAEIALRGASPGFAQADEAGRPFGETLAAVERPAAAELARFVGALDAWSRARGIPTYLGQRAKVRAGIDRLAELDPAVAGAAPWRLLGTFLAASPAAAGGDLGRSREAFEKALALAPDHLGNRVAFAESWAVKAQDRDLYEKLLQEVLGAPPQLPPLPENDVARARARELLRDVARRF